MEVKHTITLVTNGIYFHRVINGWLYYTDMKIVCSTSVVCQCQAFTLFNSLEHAKQVFNLTTQFNDIRMSNKFFKIDQQQTKHSFGIETVLSEIYRHCLKFFLI